MFCLDDDGDDNDDDDDGKVEDNVEDDDDYDNDDDYYHDSEGEWSDCMPHWVHLCAPLYVHILWKTIECICGLKNDLKWRDHEEHDM